MRDPELKYVGQNNLALATFPMKVNRGRKDKNGDWIDESYWVEVVAFGKTAEAVSEQLFQKDLVLVEGQLKVENYVNSKTEKAGQKLKMDLKEFEKLSAGSGGNTDSEPAQPTPPPPPPAPTPPPKPRQQTIADDDIPF